MKILVLAIDALDYEIFRHTKPDWLDCALVHSPVPQTGPAWDSIFTGKDIGEHGITSTYGWPDIVDHPLSPRGSATGEYHAINYQSQLRNIDTVTANLKSLGYI